MIISKERVSSQPTAFMALGSQLSAKLLLSCLWTLCSVLGTALGAVGNTGGIQRATHNVIANTGKILHTTAANQHDGVLLQVVSLSGNLGVHLMGVRQTHTGNLTHC